MNAINTFLSIRLIPKVHLSMFMLEQPIHDMNSFFREKMGVFFLFFLFQYLDRFRFIPFSSPSPLLLN